MRSALPNVFAAALCSVFFALCISALAGTSAKYRLDTLAEDLDYPWGLAFLPDGGILITELGGTLRLLSPDGTLGSPIEGVPAVYRASQGGLFDVLLDPDFARNQTLYLSYAAGDSDQNGTTVARAALRNGRLQDVSVIFTTNPSKYAPLHYGGRMILLPDDSILLTTGDGFDFREQAQVVESELGKTIRILRDGSATGNPFEQAPRVWSFGHRNPQGLAIAKDGTVYQHEHGPRGGDEVNIILPALNYGWPAATYGIDYNGALISPYQELEGMEPPIHHWTPSIAPSGLAIYEADVFPEWKNSLFVGALVDREVRRLQLSDAQVIAEETLFSELDSRIRDIRVGPDGLLYILTDGVGGALIQVRPSHAPSVAAPGAE
ncbi:MAG TPA: glucose dehydrogenase [Gammaproteobacteria bacterium]|jgi:glucose/arabinose dehydrogenase|nr:MAG: PQQ-dependent sugar dehydrogenase [Gammaproteobacteria bacterium TMED134]RZO70916.1 MAG: PQQ-dependent sugar dehydrogenase [OM182 bacterium]HAL41550.1 glucose dehydrogenase [Gammaproteobacteria bacterium]|tara:strand:+ start:17041 stop:18174 length:1134 start_codon:yes stop_codon:yes gene_type:complete